MKNPVIFTPSNAHLLAGHLWPYHGKGFFHAYTPSEVYKETAACLYRAGCAPVARLTGVFDSDTRQVAFFVCQNGKKRRTHHAHRNHPAQHAAHPTHTIRTPFANPCPNGQATCKHGGKAIGLARQDDCGLPVASAAIPPAAFSHTNFLNRLAL